MYRLSSIIAFLGLAFGLIAQSPHGEDFKMNCAACHTPDSWEIPMDAWENGTLVNPRYFDEPQKEQANEETRFNHDETNFPLEGGHAATDCRLCHNALVFNETNTECISCHTDLHNMTVGSDCARCHTVDNWLVDDVNQLHLENGFPLLGSHAIISCDECHISETGLQFNRIGNECVNCHLEDYRAATEPNHVQLGYSLACMDCHDINAFSWDANILHDFFPLVKGHDISDCNACHDNPDFTGVPTECIACHQTDYDAALNPDHKALNFGTDCAACHTLDLDWMPAQYRQHDIDYFPIYSGEHKGEWSDCIECHPSPGNYAIFTCTTCHGKSETDSEHRNVGAYVYESGACLACHPDGNEEGSFNHNDTNFPLTGAHVSVDCSSCHTNGYAGTPTDCAACHLTDFQQTTNPDHQQLGFSTDCASCHTTDPNWTPATFDHDAMYFPIYSGNHKNEWNDCADCHTVAGNYAIFSCTDCHEHNDPADLLDEHDEVNGYEYNSIKCLECHPNGD